MANEDLDDEWAAEAAEEEADRQRKAEPPPSIDRDELLAWRSPRMVLRPHPNMAGFLR